MKDCRIPLLSLAAVLSLGLLPWALGPSDEFLSRDSQTQRANLAGPWSDRSWARLPLPHQQLLAPLRATWASMSTDRRHKWLLIADRLSAMSPQLQRRAHNRVEQWARLTPGQRARARVTFLQAILRFPPKQRVRLWETYREAGPSERPQTAVEPLLRPIPLAVVQVTPGATTVLMTQIAGAPTTTRSSSGPTTRPPNRSHDGIVRIGAGNAGTAVRPVLRLQDGTCTK